jgi:hypothetical protein
MIIENKKADVNELAGKVLGGVRKAVRNLIESSAANNENLIIGDRNGNVKNVPAKELLKR